MFKNALQPAAPRWRPTERSSNAYRASYRTLCSCSASSKQGIICLVLNHSLFRYSAPHLHIAFFTINNQATTIASFDRTKHNERLWVDGRHVSSESKERGFYTYTMLISNPNLSILKMNITVATNFFQLFYQSSFQFHVLFSGDQSYVFKELYGCYFHQGIL